MNFKGIYATVIFAIIIGCSTPKKNNLEAGTSEVIKVNLNYLQDFKISELFDKVKFIGLQNDNKNFVGQIDIFKTDDKNFYLFDYGAKILFCYDNSGKHLFNIDKAGRGPGEYSFFANFSINAFTNEIEIMDSGNKKILKFSKQGKFLLEKKSNIIGDYFEIMDSSIYVLYGDYAKMVETNPNNLLMVDKNFNILRGMLPIDKRFEYFSIVYPVRFSRTKKDNLLLTEQHSNFVYEITKDTFFCKYEIDFLNHNIPETVKDILKDIDKLDSYGQIMAQKKYMKKWNEDNLCHSIDNFFETDEYLGFQFEYKNNFITFLKNKEINKTSLADNIILDNNMKLKGKILLLKDNFIYLSIDAINLVDYYKKVKNKYSREQIDRQKKTFPYLSKLYQISKEADINDNPCIIELHLK
jgi:hypothetical protein